MNRGMRGIRAGDGSPSGAHRVESKVVAASCCHGGSSQAPVLGGTEPCPLFRSHPPSRLRRRRRAPPNGAVDSPGGRGHTCRFACRRCGVAARAALCRCNQLRFRGAAFATFVPCFENSSVNSSVPPRRRARAPRRPPRSPEIRAKVAGPPGANARPGKAGPVKEARGVAAAGGVGEVKAVAHRAKAAPRARKARRRTTPHAPHARTRRGGRVRRAMPNAAATTAPTAARAASVAAAAGVAVGVAGNAPRGVPAGNAPRAKKRPRRRRPRRRAGRASHA